MQSPCKDCITLAICRSQVLSGDLFTLMGLACKCSHLKSLLLSKNKPLVKVSWETVYVYDESWDLNTTQEIMRMKDETEINSTSHLNQCLDLLKNDLLKGITFNKMFTFSQ